MTGNCTQHNYGSPNRNIEYYNDFFQVFAFFI